MKKNYIKLNDNYEHLSLGNVISVIKEESKNKTGAIQLDVFCAIFDIDDANYSSVNNYVVGSRSINDIHIQKYINLNNKFTKDENIFINICNNILTILEGTIINYNNINDINNNKRLIKVVDHLYNIAKNDISVSNSITSNINKLILDNNYYEALFSLISFSILEKKQPIYEQDIISNNIESILKNTNISLKDLQDFVTLELSEGINFSYSLLNLAKKNNSFANYQLGIEYYRGNIDGEKNVIKAYEYFSYAEKENHPSAAWMIANMIYNKEIDKDPSYAIELLNKSISLGNIAAINTLGLCYLNGFGVNKDEEKATQLFNEAASKGYAYAYNNLGNYYKDIDQDKSINYYLEAANLNESYACNKVGLHYLKNAPIKAYAYFNKGLQVTLRSKCLWNYYNLAKYYYLNGNIDAHIEKDINKAVKYFKISSTLKESKEELDKINNN